MSDIVVKGGDSIFFFDPVSDEAVDWITRFVSQEGYQPYWPTVLVEHRYVQGLVNAAINDGLEVEYER